MVPQNRKSATNILKIGPNSIRISEIKTPGQGFSLFSNKIGDAPRMHLERERERERRKEGGEGEGTRKRPFKILGTFLLTFLFGVARWGHPALYLIIYIEARVPP